MIKIKWEVKNIKIEGCKHCNNGKVKCDKCKKFINVGEDSTRAETIVGFAYYHINCYKK